MGLGSLQGSWGGLVGWSSEWQFADSTNRGRQRRDEEIAADTWVISDADCTGCECATSQSFLVCVWVCVCVFQELPVTIIPSCPSFFLLPSKKTLSASVAVTGGSGKINKPLVTHHLINSRHVDSPHPVCDVWKVFLWRPQVIDVNFYKSS